MGLFTIRPKAEELQEQVEKYDTLKITKSYRGLATLFILFSVAITTVLVFVGATAFEAIYSALIYLPIAYFVYKGKTWAMALMIVLWTYEKGLQVFGASAATSPVSIFFWWWALAITLFHAILVERARRQAVAPVLPVT